MNHNAIFIGGAGRSGTTLVADLLGLHPGVSPIYETGFVTQILGLLFVRKDLSPKQVQLAILQIMDRWSQNLPMLPNNKRAYERYHHGPHHVRLERDYVMARTAELVEAFDRGQPAVGMRRFMDALFVEHCQADRKPRWANKTPSYVHMLPLLKGLYPKMKFIHCVRDGRDVVTSLLSYKGAARDVEDAAHWWVRKAGAGVVWGGNNPDRYFELRYEELLASPVLTMRRLLDFLEEPDCAEQMIEAYGGAARFDPSRTGTWRQRFTDADVVTFDAVAGELMNKLRYQIADQQIFAKEAV
jgi:hypothetical protein